MVLAPKMPSNKYSLADLEELVEEVRLCHEHGMICVQPYRFIRKAALLIQKYCEKGLEKQKFANARESKFALSNEFGNLVDFYVDNIGEYLSLSASTLPSRRGSIRSFLAQLEQQGVKRIEDITRTAINECITQCAKKYSPGSRGWLDNIRQFLWFLYEAGITEENFRYAMPDMPPKKRVVRHGFSESEVAGMLEAVDRESWNGKRDYAFLMIASRTGLRGIDIVNLRLASIDWYANEIRISQSKTGNALSLPLEPAVGNAIADYILNSRPKSSSEYIFVKHYDPSEHYSTKISYSIVRKYMVIAGIYDKDKPYRGMHSFRRSFGKSLLESSVPIDMINELLGHADINSSRPYLAIDENGLRNCALSLNLSETEGIHNAI